MLTAVPSPEPAALSPEPPAPPLRDETAITHTKTGLTLLVLAVLLQWIPVIQYLGLVLGAVGAILMALGRRPFGDRHAWLTQGSVLLYLIAFVGELVVVASFANSVAALGSTLSPSVAGTFLDDWHGLEEAAVVAVVLTSVSYALIAFELEDTTGRLLLVVGIALQVVISVALLVTVLDPILTQAVTRAFASNPPDVSVLEAADAQINGLSGLKMLNAIPAVLFAAGYAWAWRRVARGVIPPAPRLVP